MKPLRDIVGEHQRVLEDIRVCLDILRKCVADNPADLPTGVHCLDLISRTAYEDLNQLQHEAILLAGVSLLIGQNSDLASAKWCWNPRQGGGASEPDLQAHKESMVLLSAEGTCSRSPQGATTKRMNATLEKLNRMPGTRFFLVANSEMLHRARSRIARMNYCIEVLQV